MDSIAFEMKTDIEYGMEIFNLYDYTRGIPEQDLLEYISEAILFGSSKAELILSDYPENSLESIIKKENIKVKKDNLGISSNGYVKFGELATKERILSLNVMALSVLQEYFDKNGFDYSAGDIIVAHELYHYLEYTKWGALYKKYFFKRKLFGGLLSIKQTLLPVSEIAANSFTKTILALPFNPMLLNEIYFMCH